MTIRARIDLREAESLPAALARTAYRAVQEGLTNARKHKPGGAVDVKVVTDGAAGLVVEVVSHPTLRAPVTDGHASPGAGAGLIGLSERLALIGGTLEHGRDRSGDFVLRAALPLGR